MVKLLFILTVISVVIAYFYNNPDDLPWVLNDSDRPIGYSVYTKAECFKSECSIQNEIYSLEECRENMLAIYDERKKNPTVNVFEDKASCFSECFRRTDGTSYNSDLKEGVCQKKIEVELGGF